MIHYQLAPALLVILGTAQIAGDLMELAPLRAIAAASGASPAPKVFSAVQGFETYSTRFFIEWPAHRIELTPEIYSRLRGPYNRRNVYGAVLAYAPVIPAALRVPVMRHALCGGAPLVRELGLTGGPVAGPIVVVLQPLPGTLPAGMPTRFYVPCH
jgi:hypothetical protein